MKNSEKLLSIVSQMEKNHINLYHSVSKEFVAQYVDKILVYIDDVDNEQFDFEMLKFFALFKECHTTYFLDREFLDQNFIYINEKLYVLNKDKYRIVKRINDIDVKEVINNIKKYINYETIEWCNYSLRNKVKDATYYKAIGFDFPLCCLLEDGTLIKCNEISKEEYIQLGKGNRYPKNYSYKILPEGILYLKYFRCFNEKDNLFVDFVAQIEKEVEDKNIKKYILDVRDNIGGDSRVLNPFQDLVAQKKLEGVVLMNNGTTSSGLFAVGRFKKYFNTPLIGEPTGGTVVHYGDCRYLSVEGKEFSVSTKKFNLSDIFGCEGVIQPDVYVPFSIEEIEMGKDNALYTAINLLSNREKDNVEKS